VNQNNTGIFSINEYSYPITQEVYTEIQSYLYNQENVEWVEKDAPYIKYGIKTDENEIKSIKRLARSILNNSDIGKHIVKETSIEPLQSK